LPPQEVKKYAYAYLNTPLGNFLAKLDTSTDTITKKYPIRGDISLSTIDQKGNIYFKQALPGNQAFVFYPQREKFRKLVKAKGSLLSKIFRYKDKLYVLTVEQKRSTPPYQSGLDIYSLRSKRHLKTIFFDDFGASTEKACAIDYKRGLLYTNTINLNSYNYSNDDGRTFLHIVDLNRDKRITKQDLSTWTMWDGFLSYGNEEIFLASWRKKYLKNDNKANQRSAILSYSLTNRNITEKTRFKDKRETIWQLYYDKDSAKLYLKVSNPYGFSGIRVIDCNTWKISREIPFWTVAGITKVAANKIYIEAIKKEGNNETDGIYVLDTTTDQITKLIKGNFMGIAQNAWYY